MRPTWCVCREGCGGQARLWIHARKKGAGDHHVRCSFVVAAAAAVPTGRWQKTSSSSSSGWRDTWVGGAEGNRKLAVISKESEVKTKGRRQGGDTGRRELRGASSLGSFIRWRGIVEGKKELLLAACCWGLSCCCLLCCAVL